jgi:nicotinamide riboside kinase
MISYVEKPIKIAFTGPESSGKSTISNWLSRQINGAYCEEFARSYLSDKISYGQQDLLEITKGQLEIWANADPTKHIIADTELIVIEIWSRWKYKSCDEFITAQIAKQDFDVYFLCQPDIPWTYDPLRESPNDRDELFAIYLSTLRKYNINFFVLTGSIKNRQELVKQVLTDFGLVF